MALKTKLQTKYLKEIKLLIKKEFNFSSIMQVPKLEKVVINMGLGNMSTDKSIVKDAVEEMKVITGQLPVVTRAKKSNASFKIREDMPLGIKVTLRGDNMWIFLEKLINIAIPRIRDFRGLNPNSFDGDANFTMGVREFIIFPEIKLDLVKVMKGMDISIVTTSNDKIVVLSLLKKLGFPFIEKEIKSVKK